MEDQEPFFDVLIYGEAGAGKTVLAGSADAVPQLRPVVVIDVEFGTNSLRKTYPQVDVIQAKSWEQVQDIGEELSDMNHGYQTVIWDSHTELQKLNLYYIMKKSGLNPMTDKPGWDEWGLSLEHMRKFVREVKKMPMNSIFTALLDQEKDKNGSIMRKPLFTGKFSKEVAASFDEVWFLYLREVTDEGSDTARTARVLLTEGTETAVAKDRSGNLGLYQLDPTMLTVYNKMIGNE